MQPSGLNLRFEYFRSSFVHSVATTLGLTQVSSQTMKLVSEHSVYSELVTDQEAVWAVEHWLVANHNNAKFQGSYIHKNT